MPHSTWLENYFDKKSHTSETAVENSDNLIKINGQMEQDQQVDQQRWRQMGQFPTPSHTDNSETPVAQPILAQQEQSISSAASSPLVPTDVQKSASTNTGKTATKPVNAMANMHSSQSTPLFSVPANPISGVAGSTVAKPHSTSVSVKSEKSTKAAVSDRKTSSKIRKKTASAPISNPLATPSPVAETKTQKPTGKAKKKTASLPMANSPVSDIDNDRPQTTQTIPLATSPLSGVGGTISQPVAKGKKPAVSERSQQPRVRIQAKVNIARGHKHETITQAQPKVVHSKTVHAEQPVSDMPAPVESQPTAKKSTKANRLAPPIVEQAASVENKTSDDISPASDQSAKAVATQTKSSAQKKSTGKSSAKKSTNKKAPETKKSADKTVSKAVKSASPVKTDLPADPVRALFQERLDREKSEAITEQKTAKKQVKKQAQTSEAILNAFASINSAIDQALNSNASQPNNK
ncbi:MAG: hypothetical protein HQL54_08150 [Magnetococcales bacterium]|nr:hypothetical protein [Magnetococcales bacterium]